MKTHADTLLIVGIIVLALSGSALIMTLPDLLNHHSPWPSVVLLILFLASALFTRHIRRHSSLASH